MAMAIELVADGEFGAAVSRHVRALLTVTGVSTAEASISVVVVHPFIRIGPLMMRGRAPCRTCMDIRLRQHGDELDIAVAESLRADPALAVRGFAPHHAMIAAGLVLELAAKSEPGAMAALDSRGDETTRSRLIAADGCPDCPEGR